MSCINEQTDFMFPAKFDHLIFIHSSGYTYSVFTYNLLLISFCGVIEWMSGLVKDADYLFAFGCSSQYKYHLRNR